MKLIFHTNIDKYKGHYDLWPTLPEGIVPRKGEYVEVNPDFHSYFRDKRMPIRLEVCAVTYGKNIIRVELWFSDIDFKIYGGGEKLLQ